MEKKLPAPFISPALIEAVEEELATQQREHHRHHEEDSSSSEGTTTRVAPALSNDQPDENAASVRPQVANNPRAGGGDVDYAAISDDERVKTTSSGRRLEKDKEHNETTSRLTKQTTKTTTTPTTGSKLPEGKPLPMAPKLVTRVMGRNRSKSPNPNSSSS